MENGVPPTEKHTFWWSTNGLDDLTVLGKSIIMNKIFVADKSLKNVHFGGQSVGWMIDSVG